MSIDKYRGLVVRAVAKMFAPFESTAGVRVSVNTDSYTPGQGGIWVDAKIWFPYKTLNHLEKRESK